MRFEIAAKMEKIFFLDFFYVNFNFNQDLTIKLSFVIEEENK